MTFAVSGDPASAVVPSDSAAMVVNVSLVVFGLRLDGFAVCGE